MYIKNNQSSRSELANLSLPAIEKITNIELLKLEIDLPSIAKLYASVFQEAPWNENWTSSEAEEYLKSLPASSICLGVRKSEDSTGAMAAFLIAYPLKDASNKVELEGYLQNASNIEVAKVFYFAEFGVAKSDRGQKLGTQLTKEIINQAVALGYQYLVVRTREDNIAAIKVFQDCAFDFLCKSEATTGGVNSVRVVYGRNIGLGKLS